MVRDPVKAAFGDDEDLYDVAEWDARSALDRLSVGIYGGLRASFHVLLIVLALVLFVVQLSFAALLVADQPRLGVLALASAVPALLLVWFVWYRDPTRSEPLSAMAITFVLSILFASFAAVINGVGQAVFGAIPVVGMLLFFFLVVGPIEETVKWLAIRVYAYKDDAFNTVVDGAVYGAVAGLGFAFIENAIYVIQGFTNAAQAGGVQQLQVAAMTATGRALVGPGHVLYSAFAGYYLGLAKFNPDDWGPIVVKGLLIAALIHATYNSLVTYLPRILPVWNLLVLLAFVAVFDGVVGYALYRKIVRYQDYYDRADAAERTEAARAATED
ncbi:PrsW family intramembrane metalloprotease [Halomicrobium salinisoli]|uniref:PrsW family intramembrane metalloprotease n=1 Tax=Halomicrobium salinisoli TaxID=2878391 RepID=UPI001CF09B8A|nr:PrsW family glutamic-type intramembrane protease [Halomicrobium salinisoli]